MYPTLYVLLLYVPYIGAVHNVTPGDGHFVMTGGSEKCIVTPKISNMYMMDEEMGGFGGYKTPNIYVGGYGNPQHCNSHKGMLGVF